MTAIGAVPAGGVTPPTTADIDAMTEVQVAVWAVDVQRWILGPYTGSTPVAVLQWRALALVGYALRAAGADTDALNSTVGVVRAATGVAEPHSPAGVVATNTALGAQDQTGLIEPRDPAVTDPPAPGSVDDPAYTSPTPIAGDAVEPADQTDPAEPGEGQQPVPDSPAQP